MVSYLPVPGTLGEMKTKPTQNAVRELNSYGVQPDIIIARSTASARQEAQGEARDLVQRRARAHHLRARRRLHLRRAAQFRTRPALRHAPRAFSAKRTNRRGPFGEWKRFAEHAHNGEGEVKIGIVGKYFDTGDFVLSDAYLSVIEAIKFSAYHARREARDRLAQRERVSGAIPRASKSSTDYDGIIVPGGFGETGIEGKIRRHQLRAREQDPVLRPLLRHAALVVEYARNVVGLEGANTTEIDPETRASRHRHHAGAEGKDRQARTTAARCASARIRASSRKGPSCGRHTAPKIVSERHRHRYEVNPEYIEQLEKAGLVFSGRSPEGDLMEIAELPQVRSIRSMLGTQFHPELQRPAARAASAFQRVHQGRDGALKCSLNTSCALDRQGKSLTDS